MLKLWVKLLLRIKLLSWELSLRCKLLLLRWELRLRVESLLRVKSLLHHWSSHSLLTKRITAHLSSHWIVTNLVHTSDHLLLNLLLIFFR